jgi:hypothetical protein
MYLSTLIGLNFFFNGGRARFTRMDSLETSKRPVHHDVGEHLLTISYTDFGHTDVSNDISPMTSGVLELTGHHGKYPMSDFQRKNPVANAAVSIGLLFLETGCTVCSPSLARYTVFSLPVYSIN